MSEDPIQTLIAQFSYFITEKHFNSTHIERVTTEHNVDEYKTIGTFHQKSDTIEFLKRLYRHESGDKALAVMGQMYNLIDGANEDDLEKYPSLEILEITQFDSIDNTAIITTATEPFLDIKNTTDDFYADLIENINKSYRIGVYDGAFVLTRKLLENLVIDLLRKEYPKSYLRMYYIPEQHRFRNFNDLLEVFEYRLKDYQSYSEGLDSELISDINHFRDSANSDAHNIVRNPDQDVIDDLGDDAEHAAKVMFRVLRNMD